jgi:putative two-component system response regulator
MNTTISAAEVSLGEFALAAGVDAQSRDDVADRKILIVDDEGVNVRVTKKYLVQHGFRNFITTTDSTEAIELIRTRKPDLVLLDIVMPKVSGLDILAQVRETPEFGNLPVVILTASTDPATKLSALELGATDFLSKPVDPSELIPRVRNVLLMKTHQDQLEAYTEQLEKAVQMRTFELALSRKHLIECLARAAEYRDDATGKHIIRVGRYAGVIARELGLSVEVVEDIEQAAQLHDVGKIAIPDEILKKPGSLEPAEYELMRKHCVLGLKIMQPLDAREAKILKSHPEFGARILSIESSPIIKMAARIALTHHEHWDGSGYPIGLAGEDIPIEGRITSVADVFDALSSARPYKRAIPRQKCFEIMATEAGKQFDPQVLQAFFARSSDIVRIQLEDVDDVSID